MQAKNDKSFDVGERLREERVRFGRGQEEFGAWLGGVSAKTIGNWERNIGAPDARQLAEASTHGVDVMYVLTGTKHSVIQEPEAAYRRDSPPTSTASPLSTTDQEHALRAALLNTITGSRKHGHKLNTDQFIRVVVGIYFEYLKELQAGSAEILSADETASPGQTGTHG